MFIKQSMDHAIMITWLLKPFNCFLDIFTYIILFLFRFWFFHTFSACTGHFFYPGVVAYQYTVAGSEPLLSSASNTLLAVSHTRMSVPFREAVASNVPSLLTLKHANSLLCAWMVNGAWETVVSVVKRSWKLCQSK